jgi:hypothetical protein
VHGWALTKVGVEILIKEMAGETKTNTTHLFQFIRGF